MLFTLALILGAVAPILTLTGVTSGPAELHHPALAGAGLFVAIAGVAVTLAALQPAVTPTKEVAQPALIAS